MGPTNADLYWDCRFATYFAREKMRGKLIRQSLKTSTHSVAVLRLNDLLKEDPDLAEVPDAPPTAR